METFNLYIAGLLLVGLVLTLIGVWSARHGGARLAMVGLFTGLLGLIFGGSADLLGRAKPASLEWLAPQAQTALVISGHLMENQGIFLTLAWDNSQPRLYVLPWNQQVAEQLQNAQREAEANGTQTMMRMPLADSVVDKEEPLFYAEPQPALPDKPQPQAGIRLG